MAMSVFIFIPYRAVSNGPGDSPAIPIPMHEWLAGIIRNIVSWRTQRQLVAGNYGNRTASVYQFWCDDSERFGLEIVHSVTCCAFRCFPFCRPTQNWQTRADSWLIRFAHTQRVLQQIDRSLARWLMGFGTSFFDRNIVTILFFVRQMLPYGWKTCKSSCYLFS